MRHHRPAALIASLFVAASLGGCSAPAATPAGPATSSTPAASASPSAASQPAGLGFVGRDAVVVAGRPGEAGLLAIQASNGELMALLPNGAPTGPAWGSLATATVAHDGATTMVGDVIVQPGGDGTAIRLDGAWRLPTIGADPTPVGLSADGKTLVLVPAGDDDPSRSSSRFAIVPFPPIAGAPELAPRLIELPGALDYDAISPNGRILYVAQNLDADGGYQVRAVDLPAGMIRPDPIVDKRNIDEEMAGWPLAQIRSPAGLVLTLYRGIDHPFIHALGSADAFAVCIDLPGGGDADSDGDWGLAASPDWRHVFAVNATRGLAVEIDASELVARRTVTLTTAAAPTFELAKFGHVEGGPVGRRVLTTADGSSVFAAADVGVLRLGSDLAVDGRLLEGETVQSMGLLPHGQTLFALLGEGRIVAVDAATGKLVGEVPGGGYDRLVAVMPW